MGKEITISVLLVVGVFLSLLIGVLRLFGLCNYDYDPNNPYRRYCRQCDAQQELFEDGATGTWWEVVRGGHDYCRRCNRDTRKTNF